MAKVKVGKKKASKKSVKQSSEVKAEALPDEEEEEEEEEEGGFDENITSDEEEEGDERKRQKLLEAIGSLGGKRRRTLGERSEAAVHMSEFTVNAEGEGDKIDLSDLIGSMEKTRVVSAKTRKQLKNLQRNQTTVECPLSKQESQRIQRDLAFQKAASEVSRWKSVIKQHQRAEQLVFPLNQEPPGPKPMERVVTGWKARTPLEQEVFALLNANKQPINDPVLTPAEEASMRAMSLEEAKIRRAELQKARALQSYYESKARRERKIKSKKYHKVHNKAKRKEELKRFDEMVKTDPAAALEELNRLELIRMQERMSLKHQNSGKWAKSKAIMAKYDEGARRDMQRQLEVNKELTQKVVTSLNREEDEEEEEEEGGDAAAEALPDFVNDAERALDSSNPWMRGKLSEEPEEKEASDVVDLTGDRAAAEEEEEEEEEVKETEEEVLLREFDNRRKLRQAQEADSEPAMCEEEEEKKEEQEEEEVEKKEEEVEKEGEGEEMEEEEGGASDASDQEEEELSEFTSLFRGIADGRREAEAGPADASAQLEEGLMRIRTLEDVDLLPPGGPAPEEEPVEPAPAENPPPEPAKANRKRRRGIELQEVLTKESRVLQAPLAPTTQEGEDSDQDQDPDQDLDQRGLIKEAFAGDDVVADFLKDKRRQEAAGRPQAVDLTLPGWGEWGGSGLKPTRSKRRRFRVKVPPPPPRQDRRLPAVIISEQRNAAIGAHRVSALPFPFQTQAQFESTIRSPLGRTWNTERAAAKASAPRVVTRLGAVIQPMSREELMKEQKKGADGKTGGGETRTRKQ